MPIKVLIADDSLRNRSLLSEIINGASDLEVIGVASEPIATREIIRTLKPDVLTLDVEMLRMNGFDFLDQLMRLRSIPVIVISSSNGNDSEVTTKALELGAIDCMIMPKAGSISMLQHYAEDIRDKIRAASVAHLESTIPSGVPPAPTFALPKASLSSRLLAERVIAIGASTGGTEAIKEVLSSLPAEMPPIVVVQHMPETFTSSFARRLDSVSRLRVVEAQGGERLQAGMVYLAPGHSHMRVKKNGSGFVLELSRDAPVNLHRPAVDVLFLSMADQVGRNGLGIILSGMGKDGAKGLLAMHQAGAWNIGQDQASCVVYGMPREAAAIGALDEVASLSDISRRMLTRLQTLDKRM